ncbi:site-specific recombinase XerC [Oxalobacteraceae bacterium GrIS 1.11]
MREVAGLLGRASVDTTMIYTDQDALELIRALEHESPGAKPDGAHSWFANECTVSGK